jgi:hypothetical protein
MLLFSSPPLALYFLPVVFYVAHLLLFVAGKQPQDEVYPAETAVLQCPVAVSLTAGCTVQAENDAVPHPFCHFKAFSLLSLHAPEIPAGELCRGLPPVAGKPCKTCFYAVFSRPPPLG